MIAAAEYDGWPKSPATFTVCDCGAPGILIWELGEVLHIDGASSEDCDRHAPGPDGERRG